nr:hypothetical protein [uncultured Vibrio sp.]
MRLSKKSSISLFLALFGSRFAVSAIQYCRLKFLNHSGWKHAKVRGLPHWFSVLARGEFGWRKVWQGQVYRQFFFAGLPPR